MAQFQVRKATRGNIHPKIALMAPSGGGKTFSALRLATGMIDEMGGGKKILLANTEASRGSYYANDFDYDIVDIDAPHEPEKYVDLINFAVESGYGVLIIDSTSHEWEGKGGCLELQQKAGGTYQAWAKITPRHQRFINAIADSPIAIIATMRGKDQYEMTKDERGKATVQKLGVGAKQREGFEYEFTCTFLLDQKTNCAEVTKDNTHLFEHEGPKLLTEADGKNIMKWANSGSGYTPYDRNANETKEETIDQIKAMIVEKCKALGGTKNEELMKTIESIVGSKNPNAVKDIDTAKELLAKLDNIKGV